MSCIDIKQMFLAQLKTYLDKHRMKETLELFGSEHIKQLIASDCDMIWDLIPLICNRLRGLIEFRFKTFQVCEQLLLEISILCKPKEVLIALLAELECDSNSSSDVCDYNCFKAILRPLEYVLLQLPTKRNETLKWILTTLNVLVCKLDVSSLDNYQFDAKEKLFLQNDVNVKRINNVLPLYIAFIETFVNEVDITKTVLSSLTNAQQIQRSILLKVLVSLLDHPLLHMDLSVESETICRNMAIKVVELISKLQPNIYTLYDRNDLITVTNNKSTDKSDIELTNESFMYGIANLSYLVICENLSPINFHPSIYTHVYVLGVHLQFIDVLLQQNVCLIYEKGLMLAQTLFSQINDYELDATFLELIRKNDLEKSLIKVMVYSSVKNHRMTALNVFKKLVTCFNNCGRFRLLYSLLSQTQHHSAVKELVIGLYKDYMFTDKVYLGSSLQRMISCAINASLPDGIETDIVENNHALLATLNLIRYICLKDDKNVNLTKFWDFKDFVCDNFLKQLHKAIDLSRAHYMLELRKPDDANENSEMDNFKVKIEGNNNGFLPNLPSGHRKQAIRMALHNFDLIESVLIRVEELIGQ